MPVALITGAASGIGLATARKLARDGYRVLICDRDGAAAARAAASISESGAAEAIVLDVGDLFAVKAVAARVNASFGAIDAVVANAGISGHGRGFLDIDEAQFDAMMNVHVRGHFFLLQALVPAMHAVGRGAIVLMSSIYARTGAPNMPHYAAAKGALLSLMKTLAAELGPHGIRVNAVTPGLIDTPMTRTSAAGRKDFFDARAAHVPLRRLTAANEVAEAIAWLVSPAAAGFTGQALSPSSGELMVD